MKLSLNAFKLLNGKLIPCIISFPFSSPIEIKLTHVIKTPKVL